MASKAVVLVFSLIILLKVKVKVVFSIVAINPYYTGGCGECGCCDSWRVGGGIVERLVGARFQERMCWFSLLLVMNCGCCSDCGRVGGGRCEGLVGARS